MNFKLIVMVFLVVVFSNTAYSGGYVKPDQWGGYNGKDDRTGKNITVRPDNYGGFTVKNGDRTTEMKPDKYGGYRCSEYDRNYKKSDSYYLKPDGYGGYTIDGRKVRIKKDRWGTYRW